MKFLNLLFTSSVPVLEVLIVTALGAFIATDRIALLSEEARNYMNRVVFYVFNPALVSSNLAGAVTFTTLIELWFMPINVFLTFLLGSALGWMVIILTRTPRHLRALILGVCSAGNLGNLLLIIVPAMCSETGGTFGDSATCRRNGLAYASLSMALGSIFIWTYVYNVMRISASNVVAKRIISSDHSEFAGETSETPSYSHTEEPLIPCKSTEYEKVPVHIKCLRWLNTFAAMINLQNILPPSIYGAIVGFCVGSIPPVRKLIIGDNAPLRVIETSASLVGQGAVPTITLILGGNLLSGLKGAGVKKIIIVGVLVVRFILLPMIGIAVVRGAHHFGFVKSDPLYQFVLMLQYTLPPATNISTMSQLFKAGGTECSVLMLWTYIFAAFAMTLWATLYMIIVA